MSAQKRPDTADYTAQRPMDVLPISVGFAVEYLDGVMHYEQAEIQGKWRTVRDHLMQAAIARSNSQ